MREDWSHLIIDTPKLQTLKQRYGYSMITFVFWAFWLLLWQPVASLIAWYFGFKFFYDNMISLGGIYGFLMLVGHYLIVISIIAVIFFGWANYNNMRFKGKKRRGSIWKIAISNMGNRYSLSGGQMLIFKTARRLVVSFDDGGNITNVSSKYTLKRKAEEPPTALVSPVSPSESAENSRLPLNETEDKKKS